MLRMRPGIIQSVKSQIAFSALKLYKINFNGRRIPHLVRNSHSPPISKTCWPCFELHLTTWPYSFFRTTCLYPLTLPLPLPSVSANTTRPHFTALPELILDPHLSLWVALQANNQGAFPAGRLSRDWRRPRPTLLSWAPTQLTL